LRKGNGGRKGGDRIGGAMRALLPGHANFSLGHEGAYIEFQTGRLLLLALENRIS